MIASLFKLPKELCAFRVGSRCGHGPFDLGAFADVVEKHVAKSVTGKFLLRGKQSRVYACAGILRIVRVFRKRLSKIGILMEIDNGFGNEAFARRSALEVGFENAVAKREQPVDDGEFGGASGRKFPTLGNLVDQEGNMGNEGIGSVFDRPREKAGLQLGIGEGFSSLLDDSSLLYDAQETVFGEAEKHVSLAHVVHEKHDVLVRAAAVFGRGGFSWIFSGRLEHAVELLEVQIQLVVQYGSADDLSYDVRTGTVVETEKLGKKIGEHGEVFFRWFFLRYDKRDPFGNRQVGSDA